MRSHYSAEVDEDLIDQVIEINGWVHKRRDHGGIIFLDIRDRTGIIQVVFKPEDKIIFQQADSIRHEYVIGVKGIVKLRPENQENMNLANGKIEIISSELEIINVAKTTPFQIDEYQNVSEDIRLKYRYIDLKRPELQKKLIQRTHISRCIRHYLDRQGFLEIETPFLTKSTPEGARDYIVPSRNYKGEFYALPQSPQLFKQLLMISGFDRYYQIVKCFRDEDLRADRQPEFTQVDIEASFTNEESIMSMAEGMITNLFNQCSNIRLKEPFPILKYDEVMSRYGSDKPDLRIPLEFTDIKTIVKNEEFKIFSIPANDKFSRVVALNVKNSGEKITRRMIDNYTELVSIYGASGLAYIKVNDITQGKKGLQSPIVKNLSEFTLQKIIRKTAASNGDIIFFGAGKVKIVNDSMGALRVRLGNDLNLFSKKWAPAWIIDFPMFKEIRGKYHPVHHPFTSPKENDIEELLNNPHRSISRAYDMVINGVEIGGGSIRIHNKSIQLAVFKTLGLAEEEITEKFGFFS
jgi:aspartyl-tRNA synthetase